MLNIFYHIIPSNAGNICNATTPIYFNKKHDLFPNLTEQCCCLKLTKLLKLDVNHMFNVVIMTMDEFIQEIHSPATLNNLSIGLYRQLREAGKAYFSCHISICSHMANNKVVNTCTFLQIVTQSPF